MPSQTTLAVGATLTAAIWNSNVRDGLIFLLAPPMAVLRQTSGQSMNPSGYTAVVFDTEDRDSDSGHSTISNTSRYVAQTQGWFELQGTIVWPTGMSTGAGLWVGANWKVNGSASYAKQSSASSTANLAMTTSTSLFFNVGDYVELIGGNGTPGTPTLANSDGQTRMTARWVSPF